MKLSGSAEKEKARLPNSAPFDRRKIAWQSGSEETVKLRWNEKVDW